MAWRFWAGAEKCCTMLATGAAPRLCGEAASGTGVFSSRVTTGAASGAVTSAAKGSEGTVSGTGRRKTTPATTAAAAATPARLLQSQTGTMRPFLSSCAETPSQTLGETSSVAPCSKFLTCMSNSVSFITSLSSFPATGAGPAAIWSGKWPPCIPAAGLSPCGNNLPPRTC